MKTLFALCLMLTVGVSAGCGSIHGTIVGDKPHDVVRFDYTGTASGAREFADAAQKRMDAKTHRIAVVNAGKLAREAVKEGMPGTFNERDGQVSGSAGYSGYGGYSYGYDANSQMMQAEAASLGYAQGGLPPLGQQPVLVQPGQPVPVATAPATCPKDRVAANDSERIACLEQDRTTVVKRLSKVEKR